MNLTEEVTKCPEECNGRCDNGALEMNDEDDEEDDDYVKVLETFAQRARLTGEELIPDDACCAKFRRWLIKALRSLGFNILIIVLASVDAAILMTVLLLEIESLKLGVSL
ncbi:unnamed protein product [Echinostoma caproni]|uniref:CNNM transmembrane domain-containing protein n=1 Tax=Echinostoma caproni TaxID=27848 RepID=A0A183B5J4_9TREM|nr:unnamed protein product [Echinostoma caproni]